MKFRNSIAQLVLGVLLLPVVAVAQIGPAPIPPGTPTDFAGAIIGLINYVLAIVGIIALAYLIYGGFRYITSAGNEESVDLAKRVIFNAIIGIVVIGVAAALVNFVVKGISTVGGSGAI